MNNQNWNYFYKLNLAGEEVESNLLYTPTINDDGTVLCMHYSIDKMYRNNTPTRLTSDLVDWFFHREVRFLTKLQGLKSTPELFDVDYEQQKIYIEFNKESLSQIINNPERSIDKEIPDWKEQLKNMFIEFYDANHYKLALYPHCFFLDKNRRIKTIDYYSVIPHDERYIERKLIEGVIGPGGTWRFDKSTDDGKIDFEMFHKLTINEHINTYWPYNPFIPAFEELFND